MSSLATWTKNSPIYMREVRRACGHVLVLVPGYSLALASDYQRMPSDDDRRRDREGVDVALAREVVMAPEHLTPRPPSLPATLREGGANHTALISRLRLDPPPGFAVPLPPREGEDLLAGSRVG